MNGARESILSALAAARPPETPAPRRVIPPAMPEDPIATLRARVEQAGGRLQSIDRENSTESIEWPVDPSSAGHVYSAIPGLASRGAGLEARVPHDLAPLELCAIQAEFAVVENGAAWHVPASPIERGAVLLAEHLVVVVDAEALVATLHQAYERIDLAGTHFGWLLCGPSKTADIEQAMVFGAHGPRTMSLVLLGS
jgi:L-lactate dehydrogenase complex protein LldG